MAATEPTVTDNNASEDDLDRILGEDFFDLSNLQPQQTTQPQKDAQATADGGLGIDEEVKIVKKRRPIPKLDENLLLSAAGIPKLRKISKERLRMKGKGHEYGDIARMLNMYQLWLDDLYPRAKFADGLAMIEKLGHSKRINYMRKQWIDEGKPTHTVESEADDANAESLEHTEDNSTNVVGDKKGVSVDPGLQDDVTWPEAEHSPLRGGETRQSGDDDPDEDELDALLAESERPNQSLTSALHLPRIAPVEEDMFTAEMEAMQGMEGIGDDEMYSGWA